MNYFKYFQLKIQNTWKYINSEFKSNIIILTLGILAYGIDYIVRGVTEARGEFLAFFIYFIPSLILGPIWKFLFSPYRMYVEQNELYKELSSKMEYKDEIEIRIRAKALEDGDSVGLEVFNLSDHEITRIYGTISAVTTGNLDVPISLKWYNEGGIETNIPPHTWKMLQIANYYVSMSVGSTYYYDFSVNSDMHIPDYLEEPPLELLIHIGGNRDKVSLPPIQKLFRIEVNDNSNKLSIKEITD